MTAEPTYTPSPELVEAPLRVLLRHDGYPEDHYPLAPQIDEDNRALTAAMLTAAVAYRHPTGDPELVPYEVHQAVVSDAIDTALATYDQRVREGGLVPWEQVRELVEAARAVIDVCDNVAWNCEPDNPCYSDCSLAWSTDKAEARFTLRAALAPFTQEPR